ncbi:MAG: hypothetical protein KFW07_03360 [Mycoplasmataceae bacterium]|nr:hypothetical protein [Mycoplasmataceae bacterium]
MKIILNKDVPEKFYKILGKKIKHNAIEIKDCSITICYANNGTGKSTFANEILKNFAFDEQNQKIDIKIFSYKENLTFNKNDSWTVQENKAKIDEIEIENMKIVIKFKKNIHDFFINNLEISRGEPIYKNLLKNKIFWGLNIDDKVILTKKSKYEDIDINIDNIIEILKFSNMDINNIILKNIALNESEFKINKDLISSKNYSLIKNQIEKAIDIISQILKNNQDFIEEIDNFLIEKNIKLDIISLGEINNIIEKINEMKDCYICEKKIIDFEYVKKRVKERIKEYDETMKKYKFFNELNILEKDIKIFVINEDSIIFSNYIKIINSLKHNITNFEFLKKSKIALQQINTIEEDFLNCLSIKFLKFVFVDKYDVLTNLDIEKHPIIIKNKELKILKKNRTKISSDSFDFILGVIEEYIGKNRIRFNDEDSSLIFDDSDVFTRSSSFSTGEINFIAFAFTLLLYVQEFKEKKIKAICFDDPFSSFDSNYKFYILYLINLFAHKDNIPMIILTHSYELINIQNHSGIAKKDSTNYYYLKTLSSSSQMYSNEDDLNIGFNRLSINEANQIQFRNSIHFFKVRIQDLIDKDFGKNINEIAALIYSFTPLLRALAYLMGDDDGKNSFSELMHFRRKETIFKHLNKEKFLKSILLYLKIDFLEEHKDVFFEKILFFSLNENFEEIINTIDLTIWENSNLIKRTLIIFTKSIYWRKIIEERCFVGFAGRYEETLTTKGRSLWKLRTLINNSNINSDQKIKLKSIRLIVQDNLHIEGHTNLLTPGLEYTDKLLAAHEKIIKRAVENNG